MNTAKRFFNHTSTTPGINSEHEAHEGKKRKIWNTNLIKNTKDTSTLWEVKLEEKITRNENENYHEVKYEWDQIKTKEQFFNLIEFDESKNECFLLPKSCL